jgi:hypothetical protein
MASSGQPPLDISIVAGGTIGTRDWQESIRAVVRRLVSIRSEYSTPLSLQVVFQIPGEVLRPDFSGVRTGVFPAERDGLSFRWRCLNSLRAIGRHGS